MIKYIVLIAVIICVSMQYVLGEQVSRIKIVENIFTEEQLEEGGYQRKKYSVVKELPDGSIDPNFKPIECLGISAIEGGMTKRDGTEDARSSIIMVPQDKFLLVDYFRHDSILYTWYIRRYYSDGSVDHTFHLLGSTNTYGTPVHDFYSINPQSEILYIDKVAVLNDGSLEVWCELFSPYINWTEKDALNVPHTEELWFPEGKEGILHLSPNGDYISFTPHQLGK